VNNIGKVRKKLAAGELCFGTHCSTTDADFYEMCGLMGYDYIWIDNEHAGMTQPMIKNAVIATNAGGCCAFVEPHLVPASHLLASVSGVMNACVVRGSAVGEVMFYGPGAGRRPTASAVAADIVDAAQHREHRKDTDLGAPGGVLAPADSLVSRWYVRSPDEPEHIRKYFPDAEPVYGSSRECGFITGAMDRRSLKKKLTAVKAAAAYRVLE